MFQSVAVQTEMSLKKSNLENVKGLAFFEIWIFNVKI